MVKKRSKKNLTSKQANRISLIISAIYLILSLIRGIIENPTGDNAVYYWVIGCMVGTAFIYFIFYFVIFKGEDKVREERAKVTEGITMQYLSYTDFKEVYFLAEGVGSDIDMMRKILQKEGCKFYAKLTENNNVFLIVKDKHNEEVYSAEIENHIYFNSNFKFEE